MGMCLSHATSRSCVGIKSLTMGRDVVENKLINKLNSLYSNFSIYLLQFTPILQHWSKTS
ncbi:MAG: hypothetical protein LEGION0403_FIIPPAGN_00401 [Legionella sp.]